MRKYSNDLSIFKQLESTVLLNNYSDFIYDARSDKSMNYMDFYNEVVKIASFLYREQNNIKNSIIGIYSEKSIEISLMIYVASALNIPFVVINDLYKITQVDYILKDCKANIVYISSSKEDILNNLDYKVDVLVLEKNNQLYNKKANKIVFLEDIKKDNSSVQEKKVVLGENCSEDNIASILYTSGSTEDISIYAKQELPSYMIPELNLIEKFPLNSNLKVDKNQLLKEYKNK